MRADSARSTLAGKVSERASPALMADQYFRHTWNVFVPPFDSSLSDQLREAARHPSSGARELYDQLLDRYPERVNPGALWTSARALKP